LTTAAQKRSVTRKKGSGPETRRIILESAAKSFMERGYDNTSMTDIAKLVNIQPSAFYNYFKSKNEILFTILEDIGWKMITMCKEAVESVDSNDPRLQLEAFIRAHISYEIQHCKILPLIDFHSFRATNDRSGLTKQQKKVVTDAQRELIRIIQDILKRGEQDGSFEFDDLTTTTFSLLAPIEHLIYWFESDKGRLSQSDVTENIIKFIMKALEKSSRKIRKK